MAQPGGGPPAAAHARRHAAHAARFVVPSSGEGVVLAARELAPLSASVAEVRSLVVARGRARPAASAHVIIDELAGGRSAGRFGRCARSRTSRGSSCGSGSRSCRTPGCRRRWSPTAGLPAVPDSAASTPMVDSEARRAGASASRRAGATCRDGREPGRASTDRAGRRAASPRRRLPRGRRGVRHQEAGAPRPRADRRRRPAAAAGVFTTNKARPRRCSCRASTSQRSRRTRARHRRQQRLRQRVHRRRGLAVARAAWPPTRAPPSAASRAGARGSTGVIGVQLDSTRSRAASAAAARRSSRDGARRRRPRDHDDRPVRRRKRAVRVTHAGGRRSASAAWPRAPA